MEQLDINVIIQIFGFAVVILGAVWRFPSNDTIKRLEDQLDSQATKFDDLRADMNAKFQRVYLRLEEQDAKIEERFAAQDAKFEARFERFDAKLDDQRREIKADMQRLEDRADRSNQYHARSVELLDAIRRELEDRRERL